MIYAEQLRDSRWKARSEEIKESAQRRCEECGEDEKSLDVHHSYYQTGLMAWEYPDEALHCLCRDCHEPRAQEERELLKAVHGLTKWQLYELGKHIRSMLELGNSENGLLIEKLPIFRPNRGIKRWLNDS